MVRIRRAGAEGLPLREGVEALGRERFDRLIRYLQEAVAFAKHIEAKVREIEPERAVLYADVEEVHLDGNDTLHGGISMTRDLATTFSGEGINVNAIAPGWFPTKMSRGLISQFEQKMLEGMPLGRFGGPGE